MPIRDRVHDSLETGDGIEETIMERINRADLYPQPDEVGGEEFIWELPTMNGEISVTGLFLGAATSRQESHSHLGDVVPDDRKCARCRWFEPRIFRDTIGDRYVMYTIGCSDVPGEKDLIRFRYGRDAYEAITTMKTPHPVTGVRGIVGVTHRMFEEAAKYDRPLREALIQQGILSPSDTRVWRES
jgi:hypothetical protein